MIKFLLTTWCMLAAGAIFAATPITQHQLQNSSSQIHEESVKRNSKLSIIGEHPITDKNMVPAKSGEITEVIREPEGTREIYAKTCAGWFYYDLIDMLQFYEDHNTFSTIYYGDDNTVYIKDIITTSLGTYVKGELQEDKIVINLPQTLEYSENAGYGINLCILKKTEIEDSDEYTYEYDPSIESIEYTINPENGAIKLNLPGEKWEIGDDWDPEYIIGLIWTDDNSWSGYGDYYQEFRPFSDDLTINMPENINKEKCAFISNNYGRYVDVAVDRDNNKIYIQGLCERMPEATVMANYDPTSGKAYIPQDEMLGIYVDQYFIYTKCCTYDDFYGYQLIDNNIEFELNVDLDNLTISSVDPEIYLVFNTKSNTVVWLSAFNNFTILRPNSSSCQPLNPFNLKWDNSQFPYRGTNIFKFDLSNLSIDNNILDKDNLYYRIFLDGEVVNFESNEETGAYPEIDGILTDIPFNFTNNWDIYTSNWSDTQHTIELYDNAESVGVQAIYKGNGEATYSDIITLDTETGDITTGVKIINDNSHSITGFEFFDPNGRKVNNPEKGIYIKRSHFIDGSVRTEKVILK